MEEKTKECPSGACQELQDIWAEGKGCYDRASKYCTQCGVDEPATKSICEARTLEAKAKVVAKKTTPRVSTKVLGGFGHRAGTQAEAIDKYLMIGMTKKEMVRQLDLDGLNKHEMVPSDVWTRILSHFKDLRTCHGIIITKDETGKYFGKKGE